MEAMANQIEEVTFDRLFMNMMSNPKYINQSFYSFIISKMKVQVSRKVPTAGVWFGNNVYNLTANPDFLATLTMDEGIAVLVHECQHIILQHIFRKGKRNHNLFNIAADIAINQNIINIPSSAMLPETFDFPENLTAEMYYDLLLKEKEKQEKEKEAFNKDKDEDKDEDEDGKDKDGKDKDGKDKDKDKDGKGDKDKDGKGAWEPSDGHPDLTGSEEHTLDSHEGWQEINPEDEELARDLMEKIIEQAIEKSRGNIPQNISEILAIWKKQNKISWKRVLKKFIASKKGSKISTIKRRDRRLPNRADIKGKKVHFDIPEIIVGIDVSGSMSNEEIVSGLIEINKVCELTHSSLKIVQIDTEIKGLEEYNPKQKTFIRKGAGGTYMGAMAKYLTENKVNYDVLIMISDMCIEDVSKDENWMKVKKPTLWLNTSSEKVSWDGLKNHTIMNIQDI